MYLVYLGKIYIALMYSVLLDGKALSITVNIVMSNELI